MALLIEDGTVIPDANSYVDRAAYIAYALARGVTIDDTDESDIDLINAMDYLEIQRWRGDKLQTGMPTPVGFTDDWGCFDDFAYQQPVDLPVLPEQPLSWPRIGLYTNDNLVGAILRVPDDVKKAQMQIALDIHNGFKPLVNIAVGQRLLNRKLGPISQTYSDDQRTQPLMPIAQGYLRKWVISGAIFGAEAYRA